MMTVIWVKIDDDDDDDDDYMGKDR